MNEAKEYSNNIETSDFMLTTKDNPYNPYTQWDEWLEFDHEKGYYSMEYLARVTATSDEMPTEWNDREIRRAIEDIIRLDPFGIYEKYYKKQR